jgi:TolB-like protein/Tfp pilus assembly protein PilF
MTSGCLDEGTILEFFDGRLSEGQMARVEEHVDGCALCRSWLTAAASALELQEGERGRGLGVFAVGTVVAGRYRIVRFIARGGMGEVYEADDLELGERVALKTLTAVRADDERAVGRFKREVQLQRRVSHANVCRVFDLGVHGAGKERVIFLTMELLVGESLVERLRRGRLSVESALELTRQLAAALEAAHKVGVIHRDFKSSNIMLVPRDGDVPRVVVTDFGLACAGPTEPMDNEDGSLTGSGEIVGSPEYMAPEQLTGAEVTPAADVYALGIVLYEMVTGALPFSGGSRMAVAARRLQEPAPRAHKLVPDLPRLWDQAIARCLERTPARRFAHPGELIAALTGTPRAARRWRWVGGFAAAALLAMAALMLERAHAPRGRPMATRRAVAVVGFRNLAQRADSAWLATALSEMLSSELGAGDQLRVAPGELVARMKNDLALPESDRFAAETLQRIRRRLDVDLVVDGSYVVTPSAAAARVRIDIALQDTASGETVVVLSDSADESQLLDLVARLGARLRAVLGVRQSASALAAARAAEPRDAEAARWYSEGLGRLRLFDAQGARELLARAAAVEPDFPLVHAALADAWALLGHVANEQLEARRAFEGAASLPRREQLLVEARLRMSMHQWPRALELYRGLVDFYPDDIEYGLALARAEVQASQAKEALRTLAQLTHEARGADEDPRIDVLALAADDVLGDYASAASSRLYEQIGDPKGLADATARRASLAWDANELPSAAELAAQSIAIYRRLGADGALAGELVVHAGIESDLGEHERSTREYAEALALAQKVGDKKVEAACLTSYGQQLAFQGRRDEADARLLKGLELARAIAKRNYEGVALESLGDLRLQQGDLGGAVDFQQQAVALYGEIGDATGVANSEHKLGLAALWAGDHQRAAALLNKAAAELARLGEQRRVAVVERDRAELELALGRLAEAEAHARASVDTFARLGAVGFAGESRAVLARVFLAAGKPGEARAVFDRVPRLPQEALEVRTTRAAVELANGQARAAVARLEPLPASASVPALLEAELVLGRAQELAGEVAKGRALSASAQAEARRHGLQRLTAPPNWLK